MQSRTDDAMFWPAVPSILLLSYAVLAFEVALTRIFSVMLSYHFVFAVVSSALLGLGVGAMALKRWAGRLPPAFVGTSAVLFALLVGASVLAIVKLPALQGGSFWLYLLLAILPFAAAGFAVSGIFQGFTSRSSILYGADLLGAALGALTVVPLLDALGGVNTVFFAALAAGLGALFLGVSQRKFPTFAVTGFLAIAVSFALLLVTRLNIVVPVSNDPNKDMYQMLANPAFKARIVESRWSSFGRTDVVKSDLLPNELTLFVDGAAGSAMYKADAILNDPQEAAHLTQHYGEFFPFLFLRDDEKKNALIIGPGGGRDVVVALLGGVKSITAVEVNPDVVQIVKDYRSFNGGLYAGDPRVTAIVDEGRNYVRTSRDTFDLIMLAIPVTKSSRSVEGYALTENYLFTVEAFGDYFSRLAANGRMIIVAHNDAEIYRLISMAASAFRRIGVSEQEVMKRIYTVGADMMPALVIQKQPLTAEESAAIHREMHRLGFDRTAFFVPYQRQEVIRPNARLGVEGALRMIDQFLIDVENGTVSLSALARAASVDISPVSDDRPFFYKFERGLPSPFGAFAFLIAVAAILLAALLLLRRRPSSDGSTFIGALRARPDLKRFLLLFSVLGVGYMLVEISLFQKLMLFIGQPQRALTVLLFSLLLGGGLGSLLSGMLHTKSVRTIAGVSLGCALAVLLAAVFLARVFDVGLPPRLASMALIIPIGVLLGFPFPFAMRLADAGGLSLQVSAMWGVNGIASVLGSALAMIVGIAIGFSWALFLGAALYLAVAAIFWSMRLSAPRNP